MKVFTGTIPENPCNTCLSRDTKRLCEGCAVPIAWEAQQSILSKIRDVDLNKLFVEYLRDYVVEIGETLGKYVIKSVKGKSFEEFIKEKVK